MDISPLPLNSKHPSSYKVAVTSEATGFPILYALLTIPLLKNTLLFSGYLVATIASAMDFVSLSIYFTTNSDPGSVLQPANMPLYEVIFEFLIVIDEDKLLHA